MVTIEIDAGRSTDYGDYDDCLAEAQRRYVAAHPDLDGWDLSPRWADDSRRDVILLDVPAWAESES